MPIDHELNPVLGIDLGTTFSAIARWEGQAPRAYQIKGQDTLQSAVYYDPRNDEFVVGKVGYNRGLMYPENLAVGVKRNMDNADDPIGIGGKSFSPIDLSARILHQLYKDVTDQFPTGLFKSRGSVVTVPYYFRAHQCENTRKAAELAEIECLGILQEPIAASLVYAWQLVQSRRDREHSENVLVFDLGGGTFDLTLFRLDQTSKKLVFEVLAAGGDDRLGGMDFDKCLAAWLLEKSGFSLDGLSEQDRRKADQKLLSQATEAKITLSSVEHAYIAIADVIPGEHIDTEMTRDDFVNCIAHYVEKIERIIDDLMITANVKPHDVDRVIRVGGSSMIPRMKSALSDRFGAERIYGNVNPALCVAEGASMYAAYLDDREVFGREIEIHQRTCHSLGIEKTGGLFHVLIPGNRKTPCKRRQLFTNTVDDQTSLDINIYQGSAKKVEDNSLIGTLPIIGLPARPARDLDIWVTFTVSNEQTLSVTVECDGKSSTGTIDYS